MGAKLVFRLQYLSRQVKAKLAKVRQGVARHGKVK
jgi:hypothetical protein